MISRSEYHGDTCGLKPSKAMPESGHALGIALGGIDGVTGDQQPIDPLIDRHVAYEPPGTGGAVGFLGHGIGKGNASPKVQVSRTKQFHAGFLPVVPA